MRPIELKMNAFGSYAKETAVSFDQFQRGLFLITGDTGAESYLPYMGSQADPSEQWK